MANITMIHVDERPIKMNSLRELSEEDKSSLHIVEKHIQPTAHRL